MTKSIVVPNNILHNNGERFEKVEDFIKSKNDIDDNKMITSFELQVRVDELIVITDYEVDYGRN